MPEICEVTHVADVLNKDLTGSIFLSIKHDEKSRYKDSTFPNQNFLVQGTKIKKIYAKSKKIIWVLLTPNNVEIYMISFLAIHGHWLYEKDKCNRVTFELDTKTIYYDDRDNKGTLQVCLNEKELENVYKHMGPDLLNSKVEFSDYLEVIRGKRIKGKTIAFFLLEQKYFSGVGNIYRSEILYYTGIYPLKTLENLTDKEIELIFHVTIYLLKYSYQLGGVSVMSYKDPNGIKGLYQPAIYGKELTPFGHKVTSIMEEGRKIYYSPDIQK